MQSSYILHFSNHPEILSTLSFTLNEHINNAPLLNIEVTAQHNLELNQYLGQNALFQINVTSQDAIGAQIAEAIFGGIPYPQPLRSFHLIALSCEQVSSSNDETHYRFQLSSRFTALKRHFTSRLFQNQTVPDIISALLRKHQYVGDDFRMELQHSYPLREYTTQYQETDWDFIIRICSEEGIWFRFEQQQNKDIWVFSDTPTHYLRHQHRIDYKEQAGLESVGKEVIHQFRMIHCPVAAQLRIDDYNYRTANANLAENYKAVANTVVDGSMQIWGLHHKNPEEAKAQLRLLKERNEVNRIQASGVGNVIAFTPSLVFQLTPSFNESGWLLLSVTHSASRSESYINTFTAIPAQLPYRPDRKPTPQVTGSLPARVVSPDNYTYAYLDNMGRYRVRLPFDLDEWSPGGDSRPVRLAKPYAGPQYGQHFPLHEGTEVMLSFVQGNPDRPYISGVMHDSAHIDHVNNGWNTRNVIRTWANNKLRMEDKQGQEHIKLSTNYAQTQLNLGHIVDSARTKRGDNGEGFELRTDGWGAVRSGKGLMLSAYAQSAQNKVQDMNEVISQLEQALSLARSLNKAAESAKNTATQEKTQSAQLKKSIKDLAQPALIQAAPEGIASATLKISCILQEKIFI